MTIKIKFCTTLLCVALSSMYIVKAQTVIGSGIPASKGALLELKEKTPDANNVTANKGLMLPRVNLTDWSNLFPMFSADADYVNNIGGKKDEYDKMHIGLTVYNLNNCLNAVTADGKGVYIWDGQRWNTLSDEISSLAPGVQVHKDQDGNTFYSGDFGPEAGRWMLYNMRAKKYADGTPLPTSPSLDFSSTEPRWVYPVPDGGDGTNDKWVKDFEPLGLMYNGYAALRGHKIVNMDQVQVEGDTPGVSEVESVGQIQGICPNGWHLPSDREWNKLEKEIYNNREKYSSYISTDAAFSPGTWNPIWETIDPYPPTWFRGSNSSTGHAWAMIAPCQTSIYGNSLKSNPSTKGGFYVIMAGRITTAPVGTTNFGKEGNMISSSLSNTASYGDPTMYTRSFYSDNNKVRKSKLLYEMYVSVRCKMDGT